MRKNKNKLHLVFPERTGTNEYLCDKKHPENFMHRGSLLMYSSSSRRAHISQHSSLQCQDHHPPAEDPAAVGFTGMINERFESRKMAACCTERQYTLCHSCELKDDTRFDL